jgi:hypothetical protein
MIKSVITLIVVFTVVTANAQENHNRKISSDTVFAKSVRLEALTPWWVGASSTQVNPNKELCDTIFLLKEWFDPNINNFKLDTILCFQCEEENKITSHPNNCFENYPLGNVYIQNGVQRRKE